MGALIREVEILKALDHPNIIRFYGAYEDDINLYIVMELCSGKELFHKIVNTDQIDEHNAQAIMRKILMAVNHLHANGIVHRDLKPENILFESNEENAELKIVDFGLSRKFQRKSKHFHGAVGTPYYMAPEIIKGSYNFKCDLWSIGVILYSMICRRLPFCERFDCDTFKKIKSGDFSTDNDLWRQASSDAKNLIRKLLEVNPSKRLSAAQALEHPWFKAMPQPKVSIDKSLLSSLQDYCKSSLFQKQALNILVKHLSFSDLKELKQIFIGLDQDLNGKIFRKSLTHALENSGFKLAHDEIKNLMKSIDIDKNGVINYSEFLAAALLSRHNLEQEELGYIYNQFDTNKKGFITGKDIEETFNRCGRDMNRHSVKLIMTEIGKSEEETITYAEFTNIFV
ncbi:unnamed protein product [Blepharisma stoltei]|uniref:Calcium-dependent protein kinase n=1 Tax=Blepharisma stoltei TaxID=1481888 RepID=A0AAU9JIB0_9CILI|nr:unnamed protein product [Blepharisma stoltei]